MGVAGAAIALVLTRVVVAAVAVAVYDEKVALRHLFYAQASVCTPASIEEWRCGKFCRAAPIVRSSARLLGPSARYQVRGYVARLERRRSCIVAFRGSVNLANWIADAEFSMRAWPLWETKRPCTGCTIHRGFGEAYDELREELLSALAELGCQRVEAAGHSLGAALATLTAMELRVEFGIPVGPVHLFGAPRVGNKLFAEAFEAAAEAQGVQPAAWRVIHGLDPVPRLPLALQGFQHIPREVYYTETSNAYKVCDSSGEDPDCAARDPVPLLTESEDHRRYLNVSLKRQDLPAECTGGDDNSLLVL